MSAEVAFCLRMILTENRCTLCANTALRVRDHASGLHAVAFEHLPACSAEPRPVGLQTPLNRAVIAEILAAEMLGIAGARLPLLW
jgi:hypothetical protein